MKRRWIQAVLLLAVLGLGGLTFSRLADRPRSGARGTEGGPLPAAVPERDEDLALREPARGPVRTEERESDAGSAPARAPVAAEIPAIARAEESRLVELVEAGTLRPVPEAEVWFRSWEGDWNPLAFERLTGLADTRSARADERGRVRIPWPAAESVLVLAREGERSGAGPIAPPSDPVEVVRLVLHPDWGVTLEVVEASGEPAPRVPVALTLRREGWNAVENRLTDEAGRATYPHVGLQFALEEPHSLVVGVALPLVQPLERSLERAAPSGPLRFRLPPGGEIVLTLLDPRGMPVPDGTRAQLGLVWPGETRDVSPFGRDRSRADLQSVTGRVHFEHVELGAEVELIVTRSGSHAREKVYFPGPSRAGERIERSVVVGEGRSRLAFRALDEAGAALAETELELVLEQRSLHMSQRSASTLRTDEAGRFEFELAEAFVEGDQRRLLVCARAGTLGASLDLGRPFEPGGVELGDVVLHGAPVLVAGHVLDLAGAPLPDAAVRLELWQHEGDEADPAPEYWESTEASGRSDAGGEFTVHGFVDAIRVRAWAEASARRSEVVEAPVGATGLVLTVLSTGALAGSVRVDPLVPPGALELRVVREGTEPGAHSDEDRGRHVVEPLPDGRFRFEGLLPGRYSVVVGIEDDEPELVRVAGVEVRSGETSADPRLQELDLRARVHVVRLVLHSPAGALGLEGNLVFHASGTPDPERWRGIRGSSVSLATAWERIDGTLTMHGFRPVVLANLSGEHEVELVPALRVRLVLPSSIELPEPPVYLKAALASDDGGIDWSVPVFDAGREIVCSAPAPGRLRVQWIVERRSGGAASATTMELEPVQFVELVDTAAEQRFELAVTPEVLARALVDPRNR